MPKIIVTQSKKIQKRVLKIAKGMSFDDIQHVIDSMDCNDHRFSSGESQKVWQAYLNGWRGNDVDNVNPMVKAVSMRSKIYSIFRTLVKGAV